MTFSSFLHGRGIPVVPDVKIVSGSYSESQVEQGSDEFCYVLNISRVVAEETSVGKDLSLRSELSSGSLGTSEGLSLRKLDSFLCRSFQTAKEMMLDSGLLQTDWVKRRKESDAEGKVMEIYMSTDGHYMAKISRVELF